MNGKSNRDYMCQSALIGTRRGALFHEISLAKRVLVSFQAKSLATALAPGEAHVEQHGRR